MNLIPNLSDSEILAQTTEKVFRRGVDYFNDDTVSSVIGRGQTVQADVEGSEDEPYLVSITFSKQSVLLATCTCPYGEEWAGWCKHIVATLLFCRDHASEVEELPPLETLLADWDREALVGLLLGLIGDHPRLLQDIAHRVTQRPNG